MKSLTARAPSMKHLADKLVRIIGNPAAEVAIGALLAGTGLYLSFASAATPTLMTLGGSAALAVGALQLRRRRAGQTNVSRKRMMGLTAAGGVLLAGGVMAMVETAPFPALLMLLGAMCGGLGAFRVRAKRRGPRTGEIEPVGLTRSQRQPIELITQSEEKSD